MTTLDPEEFRARYDYWGLVGPEVMAGTQQARQDAAFEGFEWSVESVSASSEERNGRTVATFDELAVRFASTAAGAEADVVVALNTEGLTVGGTLLGSPVNVSIDQERATGRATIEGDPVEFDIDLLTHEGYVQVGPERVDLSREGDCLVATTDGERVLCDEESGLPGSTAAFDVQEDWQAIGERAGTIYGVTDLLRATDREQIDELIDSYAELFDNIGGTPF